ncbi:MAG: carbohydrate kinase [Pseudonocardiaceae bacterium]|nr:carbohydrate kinase [Pseudonocardiaceae bacterium]
MSGDASPGSHRHSRPGRVVVGGEALVDLVPAHDGTLAPRLGGGPFNVAVALGRLGVPSTFLSRLSTDAFGEALLARLRESGVDASLVQRGPQPTTLAVVELAPDGSASYGFYTEGTADRLVADPGPLPGDVAAVCLGTLSLVLEPGASVYEAVLHREAAAGRLTVLDPNVRAALIPDAAAYRARLHSWLASVGLLKLSVEDAGWLAAGLDVGLDVERALQCWLDAGPAAVVLTRGGDGLSVRTAGTRVDVATPAVAVADAIGAGDTVAAALLGRLHDRGALDRDSLTALDADGWRDVLGFAARAAAVTVSRAGADPPWRHELGH